MSGYFKQEPTGKWSVQFSYEDYTGQRRRKHKLGFNTKKEANAWMNEFIRKQKSDMDMLFSTFIKGALSEQGFKGGTRGMTEWNQWIEAKKQELSKVMGRYGV